MFRHRAVVALVSICTPVDLQAGHPSNEIVSLLNEEPKAHRGVDYRKTDDQEATTVLDRGQNCWDRAACRLRQEI
jgi:hypothetical protein